MKRGLERNIEINDSLLQVVQTVSRFARNLDADGSVRVPRQIGAAPLGPPGPYR